MRRFAEDTEVSVGRSRGEIDDLLRRWGADGIQWTDSFTEGRVQLRFLWKHEGVPYMARLDLRLPDEKALRAHAIDGRSKRFSESKLQKLRESRGRREHRVLALWIKAALNAVEVGIVKPEELFLSFLEGRDGRTVAEVALPRLPRLLQGSASLMLPAGGPRTDPHKSERELS